MPALKKSSMLSDLENEIVRMDVETFKSFCAGRITVGIGAGKFHEAVALVIHLTRLRTIWESAGLTKQVRKELSSRERYNKKRRDARKAK